MENKIEDEDAIDFYLEDFTVVRSIRPRFPPDVKCFSATLYSNLVKSLLVLIYCRIIANLSLE